MKDNAEELKKVIERLHNCVAQFLKTFHVREIFQGNPVWEGIVFVFALEGHPQADKCYAWSSPIEGSTKRRYYAVLHIPPIDSPEKAVRASIIYDHKTKKPK